jgi:RNA polymerase sigma-70 factor (ECF subfamily)
MLFQHSRRRARVDADGELVTLENQDRSVWDQDEMRQAGESLQGSWSGRQAGAYALQAAIAACHAEASEPAATDWKRIATLYERLLEVAPHPLVRLNHAVAVAMAFSPAEGLLLVDELDASGQLQGYYLLHATRAELLRRMNRFAEAAPAYEEALRHARSDVERRFLSRRLAELNP